MPFKTISINPNQIKSNRDLTSKIYWENLNHEYIINSNYKYCIFINGCFCPPHKGHINSIHEAIKIFGPNAKIIINQIGSSYRHGVPKEFNKYMMETYINTIFKSNPNIKLFFRARNKEIFLNDFVLNSDVLVIVRGDEVDSEDKETSIDSINKTYIRKFSKIIHYLNKKYIKVDFIFQFRPINEVSATRFVELLGIYKKKCSEHKECIEDMFELYYMMPEQIDIETKYKIIKQLISFNTYTKMDAHKNTYQGNKNITHDKNLYIK